MMNKLSLILLAVLALTGCAGIPFGSCPPGTGFDFNRETGMASCVGTQYIYWDANLAPLSDLK